MQTLEVSVPPNVAAGQTLSISAPTGQLLQVVVPSGLAAGDKFLVSLPVAVPSAVPVAMPVAMPVGSQQACLLAKLGAIGHFSFELHSTRVSSTGLTSIEGSMPVTSGGHRVATLVFQSGQTGQHLAASLVLPSGEVMATFERGTAPKTTAGGVLKTLAADFRTGPAPPVAVSLRGQPYGFFKTRGTERWMGAILQGTDFGYVGSSKLIASTPPQPRGGLGWKLDNVGGYKFTSRKKSSLGKKEAPLPVFFGGAADGVIHVVPEGMNSYFAAREVLCEPGNKQDVLLMSAAMALVVATEKRVAHGM